MTKRASTILLVEDDRAIRYLFTQVLRGAGHTVIACEDGLKGLTEARERITEIDAVVTDSRMPGLSGQELIAQIRALRPEMPILVVSGGIEEGAARVPADVRTVYLSKPLAPDGLRVELDRLLSGRM